MPACGGPDVGAPDCDCAIADRPSHAMAVTLTTVFLCVNMVLTCGMVAAAATAMKVQPIGSSA
jgi:hypothetical protein